MTSVIAPTPALQRAT